MDMTVRPEDTLTVGEVCEAIEAGKVAYTVEDGSYVITRAALRRLQYPDLPWPPALTGPTDPTAELDPGRLS